MIFVGNGLVLAVGNDVANPQIRSRILDLGTAMTADPVAELEERGVEL